ncbi:hypothetical protein [Streptomyces hiroshimensis]|uniref:Sulfite exporter TauE/SafE family protein n=1 Tax=Streptomyces hiroshimensis TaxID=66424 RepID=A0ABQ2YD78_9ACTN|nr:hypothetical protein [Streptomyces hiroshimensis]GGX78556.1 hypothetical protein GCM10010324_25150 [Streptomyces hiroshimensis]
MTQQAEPGAIPEAAPVDAEAGTGPEETSRAQKRVMHPDGFGAAFCASMAALCAEAAVAGTTGILVMLSREHEGLPHGLLVIAGLVFAVALLGVLVSGFVTAVTVMPALALARTVTRRLGRRDGLLWNAAAVPFVSAAVVAVFGGVSAVGSLSLAAPLKYLLWWASLTVALLPATLIAGVAGRRVRDGRYARVARRVVRDGVIAWLAVGAVGAAVYGTGAVKVYQPPKLDTAQFAGVWTDGRDGTVKLAADGTAVADGLDNYVWDGTGKDRPKDCDGSGTWQPVKDQGRIQGLSLRIGSCELKRNWSVSGTDKEPRLFHEIGKPGSGKRYVLTKVVKHKK